MANIPAVLGLIVFLLSGRLFLKTFKTKPDGWQLRCGLFLILSLSAFFLILFGINQE